MFNANAEVLSLLNHLSPACFSLSNSYAQIEMKLIPRIVLIILLLASWTALYVEHNAKIKAQEDLQRLQADLTAAQGDIAKKDEQAKHRDAEITKLRETTREVYKLRSEAGQLKSQQQAVEQLRAENQQLRSAPAADASAAASNLADGNSLAKENWVFAGYASPEATLQSIGWAMREGDKIKMLAGLTDDERARMAEHWKNKTPEEFRADTQNEMKDVKGFRIMDRQPVSDDEVILSVYTDGKDEITKFSLKRVGNEWKFGGRARK